MYDELNSMVPLLRFGTSYDIANAGLFLASGAGSYHSGFNIVIDGGLYLVAPNFPLNDSKIQK